MLAAAHDEGAALIDEPLFWLLSAVALGALVAWLAYRRKQDRRADQLAAKRADARRLAEIDGEAAADRAAEIDADLQREARAAAESEAAAKAVAEQAERDRVAADLAEAERQARADAEREAAVQAAAERVAAEQAEREHAAALAEAERQARTQAEREAAALATVERAAAERVAAQQAERERMAALVLAAEQAAAAEAERQRAAVPPPPIATATKSAEQTLVMVADDSKVVRIKTGRLLAAHQYQVCFAIDGLEAAQLLQTQVPDVVITDVEMPGMDGFELTRHIRNSPATAHIPVIMITAADDRHREHADSAGVSVLMGKPYPDDALIAHIRVAMGHDTSVAPG